jgi:hypothetical protein
MSNNCLLESEDSDYHLRLRDDVELFHELCSWNMLAAQTHATSQIIALVIQSAELVIGRKID